MCTVHQNLANFGILYLQGSGVTPLMHGEKYDISFVANFVENVAIKN